LNCTEQDVLYPFRGPAPASKRTGPGNVQWRYSSPERINNGPTFSRDSRYLAATGGSEIKVWKLSDGEVAFWTQAKAPFSTVAFTHDATRLAAGEENGRIALWEWKTGRQVASYAGHTSAIESLAVARDGSHLVSTSRGNYRHGPAATLWDLRKPQEAMVVDRLSHGAGKVLFSPNGRYCAFVADGLYVWDTNRCPGRKRDNKHPSRRLPLSREAKIIKNPCPVLPRSAESRLEQTRFAR
jgi:WD40 repeat protein